MNSKSICVAVALQRYIDFTPIALRQREIAAVLAHGYGARLTVVSVNAPVDLLPGLETTEEKLDRYTQPLREDGFDVRGILRTGKPSREILEVLEEVGADLLIIGSHSKRGPLDVGLGSTVSAMPQDLEIPLLIVRPTLSETERAHELIIPRYPMVFPYG